MKDSANTVRNPLHELLEGFAIKYIWWKKPEDSLLFANRIIAQVMELGTFQDVQKLVQIAGEARLKQVLQTAEAGWFTPRSWHYWHLRMGVCDIGKIPPLPKRAIP